ncbi:HipA family kinase [Actinokineospora bangkokensis]|uniref:HipA-like kinase domain-containing protein n=1 Tax=Actinokineospora bangkokensis TaxID=1193682 RepID=A0A1Q9LKF1_9PSEU|nr:HipA family kinase [Actinokineospora bangkokensis]OLR92537.1 hypothetical protein BJP25_20970 [Actinokineospora bangkokensis]
MPRTVTATRYVTPLREGGSLPGLVEADDLGMYVVKFRGAGQGPRALVAEQVVGGLARSLGFRVPELVFVELDPELGRTEPDEEVQELLRASGGRNLGLDFLPGSFDYNPLVRDPGPVEAARLLWFDALVLNVDRSWRNPNLLLWHRQTWLIDHGAALYPHHRWGPGWSPAPRYRWDAGDHVMLPVAGEVANLAAEVDLDVLDGLLAEVPDEWLLGFPDPADTRRAYHDFFTARLATAAEWTGELEAARAARV